MAEVPRDTIRVYRQLLQETRTYWPHILLPSFVNLLSTPIALLTPLPLKIAVDSIAGSTPLPGFYRTMVPDLFSRSATGLMIFTVVMALNVVGSTRFRASRRGCSKPTRASGWCSISARDSSDTSSGVPLLSRQQRHCGLDAPAIDAQSIQNIAVNGVMPFISSTLTLLAMIYVIARIDWTLAVVALAASPLLFWASRASVGELRESWKNVRQLESSAMSVLQEVLASIRVVKAFVREDHEQERFISRSRTRLTELIRVVLLQMKFDVTISLLIAVTSAITLSLGILHVRAARSRWAVCCW